MISHFLNGDGKPNNQERLIVFFLCHFHGMGTFFLFFFLQLSELKKKFWVFCFFKEENVFEGWIIGILNVHPFKYTKEKVQCFSFRFFFNL